MVLASPDPMSMVKHADQTQCRKASARGDSPSNMILVRVSAAFAQAPAAAQSNHRQGRTAYQSFSGGPGSRPEGSRRVDGRALA